MNSRYRYRLLLAPRCFSQFFSSKTGIRLGLGNFSRDWYDVKMSTDSSIVVFKKVFLIKCSCGINILTLFQQFPTLFVCRTGMVAENYRGTKVEIQSVTKNGISQA